MPGARRKTDSRPSSIQGRNSVRVAMITVAVLCVLAHSHATALAHEGALNTIRADVRDGEPSQGASSSQAARRRESESCIEGDGWDGNMILGGLYLTGLAVSSPIWVPDAMLGDDFVSRGYFLDFPYDGATGHVVSDEYAAGGKIWAARFDAEYVETFDRIESIGGHLLLDTTFRVGLDTSFSHLQERHRHGRLDTLDIGDCNFVYRFAQGDWAEFRTGLGLNWLNDSPHGDVGFNFTYAADIYPCKPWVISAAIDWGTLGEAELFRFRTTAGLVFHGIETYAGYEYTDIGRTQWNGLVAGLRFWF